MQIDATFYLRAGWQPRVTCVEQVEEGPELVLEVARHHLHDVFLHGLLSNLVEESLQVGVHLRVPSAAKSG